MIVATKTYTRGKQITLLTTPFINVTDFALITNNGIAGTGSFVNKTFRYSTDGVNYSEWLDLSQLTSLTFLESDLLSLEIMYEKDDINSTITLDSISLLDNQGTYEIDNTFFNKFHFSKFFESLDTEVLVWLVNVFQKVYETGQLQIPSFMERLDENHSNEDFIKFWKPIIQYFAYYVIFSRKYQEFYNIPFLLEEFLLQRGIFVSLTDMDYTYEIPAEGSTSIPATKTFQIVDGNVVPPFTAGTTIMRFILDNEEIVTTPVDIHPYGISDLADKIVTETEFIANAVEGPSGVWSLEITAPADSGSLYNNVEVGVTWMSGGVYSILENGSFSEARVVNSAQYIMEKFYTEMSERGTNRITKKFRPWEDIYTNGELRRLTQTKSVDPQITNYHLPQNFGWNLGNSSPLYRGVRINPNVDMFKKGLGDRIPVNPFVSYELTFRLTDQAELELEIVYRDKFNILNDLLNHSDSSPQNIPFSMDLYRTDKYTYVTVHVFSMLRAMYPDDITTLNQGNNLRFTVDGVSLGDYNFDYNEDFSILLETVARGFSLEFQFRDKLGEDISQSIEDWKFNPIFTNYSHGVLQTANWVSSWLVNNNRNFNTQQLQSYIQGKLVNYGSHHEIVLPSYDGEQLPGSEEPEYPIFITIEMVELNGGNVTNLISKNKNVLTLLGGGYPASNGANIEHVLEIKEFNPMALTFSLDFPVDVRLVQYINNVAVDITTITSTGGPSDYDLKPLILSPEDIVTIVLGGA